MLYSHIHIQIYAETESTIMTNFNEGMNTLLYKNISLTLYSQKGDGCCVWEMSWRRGGTGILTPSSSDHSSTSSSSWLGCSTMGHWGLSVCRWLSIQHLVSNLLHFQLTQAICVLVIFLFDAHLLPLFSCLFTQVHLLIEGSVKGQYATLRFEDLFNIKRNMIAHHLIIRKERHFRGTLASWIQWAECHRDCYEEN